MGKDTGKVAGRPELYFHDRYNAYECRGCGELIEVPKTAYLKQNAVRAERIQGNPENLMLWVEMHTLEHTECHEFADQAMAKAARLHRKEGKRRKILAGMRRVVPASFRVLG